MTETVGRNRLVIPRAADANEGSGTGKETGVRQDGTEPEDRAEGNSEN